MYSTNLALLTDCLMILPSKLICSVLLGSAWASTQVNVGNTRITGTLYEPSNVEFFGGIPFAKPPIGNLRFKPAVLLPTPEVPTLNATRNGPICLQIPPESVSEDCLTLNVYRPPGLSPDSKLPVMFWIFGGGYVIGGSSMYNGSDLVAYSVARGTPVIFVNFNHRVGPLGFPQGIEAGQRKTLNLGFSDQLAALQWVHKNIANFGGDNSKITVFGESSGAASAVIHLHGTEIGKFARAVILQSFSTLPTFKPERNEGAWQQFVAAVPSCAHVANTTNTFDCLLKADSASFVKALVTEGIGAGSSSYQPVIDGHDGFLPDRPSKLIYKTYLPILIGSNLDEGTLFTPRNIDSEDQIRDSLRSTTSPPLDPEKQATGIEKILQLYPDVPALGSPFRTGNNTFGLSSQYKRFSAIQGDYIFESPRRFLIQKMNEACVKVYGYKFVDAGAYNANPNYNPASGIMHGMELQYVFNSFIFPGPTTSALALGRIMQDYWISFATNLDPNDGRGFERPYWAQYSPTNQNLMQLNGTNSKLLLDDFRLQQISFFEENPDLLHE